jgi:preprotein translocase subunit SecG
MDEGSYRFFTDLYRISCEFTGEGNYVNCSDKTPEVIRPKDQGFDEAAEKIVNITSSNSKYDLNLFQISSKELFNSKFKTIMWTIIIIISVIVFITILIIICYCNSNRTKVAVTAASGQSN